MTPTERLRELLDERGVEWKAPNSILRDDMTSYVANGFDIDAFEMPDGTIHLTGCNHDDITSPEQAIAATLGRGTTTRNGKTRKRYGRQVPLCECCGYAIGDERYHFCPNCGARIEDE